MYLSIHLSDLSSVLHPVTPSLGDCTHLVKRETHFVAYPGPGKVASALTASQDSTDFTWGPARADARAYTYHPDREPDRCHAASVYSLDHPFVTATARSAPPAVGGGRRARRLGARRDGCAPGVAALPMQMPVRCGGRRARGASALRHVVITPARRPVRGGGRGARTARAAAHLALPRGHARAEPVADRPLVAQRHAVARAVLARAVLAHAARAAAGVGAGAWAEAAGAAGGVAADTAGARRAPPRAAEHSRPRLCRPRAARARADRNPALIRVTARRLGG